jgi:hypothetical protein
MYVRNKADHVRSVASDPLEAVRLLRTALATVYFRYSATCAAARAKARSSARTIA